MAPPPLWFCKLLVTGVAGLLQLQREMNMAEGSGGGENHRPG